MPGFAHIVCTHFDADSLVAELRSAWFSPLVLGEYLMRHNLARGALPAGSTIIALAR